VSPQRLLWIDTDAGFDDLVAIAIAADAPDCTILGVSLVAGNAPLPAVIDNYARAAAFFGWRFPVFAGAAAPLASALQTAETVLGQGGLSTIGRPFPAAASNLAAGDAVAAMRAALSAAPSPVTLLPLGPLTNIARLLADGAAVASNIAEIVLMGGSAGRGNHTAAAEFNIACDPEAAAQVFAAGLPIRMFGLDIGRACPVEKADADAVRQVGGERAAILADHFEAYLRIADPAGLKPMALYDPTAAAWLADPAWVSLEPAQVVVELAGRYTRGMTVCEFRPQRYDRPNALIAMTGDRARYRAIVRAALIAAARAETRRPA
jgi:purine nucleosidase